MKKKRRESKGKKTNKEKQKRKMEKKDEKMVNPQNVDKATSGALCEL